MEGKDGNIVNLDDFRDKNKSEDPPRDAGTDGEGAEVIKMDPLVNAYKKLEKLPLQIQLVEVTTFIVGWTRPDKEHANLEEYVQSSNAFANGFNPGEAHALRTYIAKILQKSSAGDSFIEMAQNSHSVATEVLNALRYTVVERQRNESSEPSKEELVRENNAEQPIASDKKSPLGGNVNITV